MAASLSSALSTTIKIMAKKSKVMAENQEVSEHIKKQKTAKKRELKTDRKVYYMSGKENKDTPKILLEGWWLRDYGFKVGDTLKLTIEEGLITLKRNE